MRARSLDFLVVGATPGELARVRGALDRCRQTETGGRPLAEGRVGDIRVGALVTGVGKVNAALALGSVLSGWRVGVLLCVGVGGAFPDSGLGPGDLAVAREEIYGDEGADDGGEFLDMEAIGIPLWEAPTVQYFNRFPANSEIGAALLAISRELGRAARGPFVTVSTVTGTRARAEALGTRCGAVCETMEGAAVAHAAVSRGIPFGEVRGISNLVGPRDRGSWRLAEAAEVAGEVVVRLLRSGWCPASSAVPS